MAAAFALAPASGGPSSPGGSIDDNGVLGGTALAGVLGAEAISLGTRLERTRMGGFLRGPSVRSTAVAGRAGGGGAGEGGVCDLKAEDPGEAVCARGGGGGGEGAAASDPG